MNHFPLSLNGVWAFRFEEGKSIEDVADPAFVATDRMTVPGCFDIMPQWYLKRGTALYRRSFTLAEPVPNAWLTVEGMGLRGDFRIDGRPLGVHPCPYSTLELETGPLDAGEHVIFAALDNRFDWATMKLARPYYDFYFYGGFYHGVSLSFDNRKLFVRTRDWRAGIVEIEAVNFESGDFDAQLTFDGKNESTAAFRAGRATVTVPDAKPWSPASPHLHTVTVRQAGADVSARFGIRQVEARDRRIWLNGEPIYLKGANRHDTVPESGTATTQEQMLRDLQNLKSLGGNFIRGAHYPQSRVFLDLCDELGILVWEESLGWGNGQSYTMAGDGYDELEDAGFCDLQVVETRRMVRASFNHPCVILCGFMNELAGQKDSARALVKRLADTIRAEDSGRLVTFACNRWKDDLCNEFTDVVAFNAYPGTIPCYPGLPEDLSRQVKDDPGQGFNTVVRHFRSLYPDKPIMLSESGCAGEYGLHDPAAGWGSEEFQAEYIEDILETVFGNPDIAGCCIWQLNDNRTYHRNSRAQAGKLWAGFSAAGIFDRYRRPKKSAEVVKRLFAGQAPV